MLRSLYVKDLAIVDEVEVAVGAGLSVVTGETGAGKSLLVDALVLLSGGRADAGVVRHGCERAELSAEFDISANPGLLDWLRDEELDDGQGCQLRRVIRSEGSSRAWINGRPVTLGQMKVLGAQLIEIHGQHEHQALLERARQLALLDAYADHHQQLQDLRTMVGEWKSIHERIAAISSHEDPNERIEWLNHQLAELDSIALAPEDLARLEETHRRLANSGQLMTACSHLAELLDADSEFSLSQLLTRAVGESHRLAGLDPATQATAELLESASIHVSESIDALRRYQDALALDPERLAEIESQLGRLHDLARKHRRPVGELDAHAQQLRGELEALANAGGELERLGRERNALLARYAESCARLGESRRRAGAELSASVNALLGELGMAGGQFSVALESTNNTEPDSQGGERCEFLVSANPGQPLRPLRKVASGGELSRIGLAIEVAALGMDEVGTMVFDEVDAGIGGAVAEVVGQKLRRLGSRRQVLCVTHLPQVAAQGHAHLMVSKLASEGGTRTQIEHLSGDARRDELARMLGGIKISPETLAHAEQMLRSAARS
jgi:DNA repair protein RecN (Recombination protein N)